MQAGAIRKKYADGGKLHGKGTGTSDSIPIMASNGEYMMPADSVKRIGVKVLDAMKDATHRPGKKKGMGAIRKMAEGGLIDDPLRRQVIARPNFTIPRAKPAPQLALPAPTPGTAVIQSTAPNFVRPGIDAPFPPQPAVGNPNVQDVRAKWRPSNASPEARAYMAGQQTAAPAATATGAQPVKGPGVLSRMNEGLKTVSAIGEPPVGALGRVAGAAGTALRFAGRASPYLAAGNEAVDVGKVAMNQNATGIDVASQVAQGVGRLGAAGTGAGAGAALGTAVFPGVGTVIGGLAGGALGYYGADKAIEAGRSAIGVDPASPASQAPPMIPASVVPVGPASTGAQTTPATGQQPQSTALPATGAGTGRGTVNPPLASATGDARPDLAGIPSLAGGTGTAVDGADGVRKFTTADGRTLYSNVAGADNDRLMARGAISPQNDAAAQALSDRYAGQAAGPIGQLAAGGVQSADQSGVLSNGAGMRVLGQSPSSLFARTPEQQARDRDFDTSVARTRAYSALRLNPGRRGAAMAREIMAGVVEPERNRVTAEGVQVREAGENQRAALREGGSTQREQLRAGALQANAAATNKIAEANLGINQARLGVEQGKAATDERSRAALISAQSAFMNAKTPEEKNAAAQALAVLQGRTRETPDLFDRVQTGVDPNTGAPIFGIYSKRTGQMVNQQPAGNAPTVGTVKNGYKFKGGNPADKNSWERV